MVPSLVVLQYLKSNNPGQSRGRSLYHVRARHTINKHKVDKFTSTILTDTLLPGEPEPEKGAVIMADGKQVTAADLGIGRGEDHEELSLNLREVRQRAESKAIRVALMRNFGNISRAAEQLGVTRPTLYDLLNKYGLSAEAYSKRSVNGGGAE